jgi:hypothetical protein
MLQISGSHFHFGKAKQRQQKENRDLLQKSNEKFARG